MDLLVRQGGHVIAPDGRPRTVTGQELLLQQALHLLTIPRGSFPYDPQLGSRLHQLGWGEEEEMERGALILVSEALAPLPQVTIMGLTVLINSPDQLTLTICLQIENNDYTLEVTV